MKRLDLTPIVVAAFGIGMMSLACGDDPGGDDGSMSGGLPLPTGGAATEGSADETVDDTGEKLDAAQGSGGPTCNNGDVGCTDMIDMLFVIDNSGTMGEEQINLARNFPLLINQLENLVDSQGMPVNADVQIMVTTTDFDNPLCTPFHPPEYEPLKGAPVNTACTARIDDFTDLFNVPIPEACTNTCPVPVAPDGNYIAFSNGVDNIPDAVVPVDIDGDGVPESPAAQALACVGPQGVNGCGYESPLETMLQALNPHAAWNDGPDEDSPNPAPFLREGALLALAVITDEADCSVKDYTIMDNEAFHNIDPMSGDPEQSSAICWNAGVECTGPDVDGVFSECHSEEQEHLQPTWRYTDYLINELRENQGKEVIMLGILGVPLVTAHNPEPPFEPTAGGVLALEYRNWRDGQYPAGDILPEEFMGGTNAADKQFDFGIGPGCTGTDELGNFTGQAIPPVRVREVCESLNLEGDNGVRCCIESICDDDFSAAIGCLTGIIQESIQLPG